MQQGLFQMSDVKAKYTWPNDIVKGMSSRPFDQGMFGFDIETQGLDPYGKDTYVRSVALSVGQTTYVSLLQSGIQKYNQADLLSVIEALESDKVTLIGHNIKFDLKFFAIKYGIQIKCKVFDTMLASYFLDENTDGDLDSVIKTYLNQPSHKKMVSVKNLGGEHPDDMLLYNALDARTEIDLFKVQVTLLHRIGALPLALLAMDVIPLLVNIEARGVNLDREWAKSTEQELIQDCIKLRMKLKNAGYGAFSPDSDKDLRRILYDVIGFSVVKRTKSDLPSTDSEAIGYCKDEATTPQTMQFLENLSEYTKKMKLLSTYYQPLDRLLSFDKRIHTQYALGKDWENDGGGTVTGRLSSRSPNLQNIPRGKRHRGMFIPTQGFKFIDGDFSQLELRMVAFLSGETVMIRAFQEGKDIHTAVMADMLVYKYDELVKLLEDHKHPKYDELKGLRVAIKRINFGIVYGIGAQRLQKLIKFELGLEWELDACQDLIDQWLGRYTRVRLFLEKVRELACQNKEVTMILGQRRRLPDAMKFFRGMDRRLRALASRAMRQATNFVVQSPASWVCLIGMLLVQRYFDDNPELQGHICFQVHDSVTCEVIETCDLESVRLDIQNIMEQDVPKFLMDYFGINFNVPLSFPTQVIDRWE